MNTRNKYGQYFEKKQRYDTGEVFVCLTANAPEELREFVHSVHKQFYDCLLNHWIYYEILEAFEQLEENELEDISTEADHYHSDLYKWLGEPFADEFCSEYMQDFSTPKTIWEAIEGGQYLARTQIYSAVNDFIQEGGIENE